MNETEEVLSGGTLGYEAERLIMSWSYNRHLMTLNSKTGSGLLDWSINICVSYRKLLSVSTMTASLPSPSQTQTNIYHRHATSENNSSGDLGF